MLTPLLRAVQVLTAVIYCLFAAGIVFGYAALKPVLIREHVYRNLCTKDELEKGVRTCYDQEVHLNLMFTVAAVGTNVAALPIGAILDTLGPRVCGIIGSFLLAIGAVLFAFASEAPFDAYIPGYLFLALGGPFVFISSFQLSNTFPKHSGLILALLTGAFDSSSAIFLVYRMIYQRSNGSFWPKKFFLVYLIVPALILLVQVFLMPKASYKTVGELVRQVEEADTNTMTKWTNIQLFCKTKDGRTANPSSPRSQICWAQNLEESKSSKRSAKTPSRASGVRCMGRL